jgi:hypothetical protein
VIGQRLLDEIHDERARISHPLKRTACMLHGSGESGGSGAQLTDGEGGIRTLERG